MANNLIMGALRANARSFSLSAKKIEELPRCVTRLICISSLHLNNNLLFDLPIELQALQQLAELNLGNNNFLDIPVVLKHLPALKKLYLYGNKLKTLPEDILEALPNLTLLNVNHNQIKVIPPQIKSLQKLEVLSMVGNELEFVPDELCCCVSLTELNLTSNRVTSLPALLGSLFNLKKLYLARNDLYDLPEGISGCHKLKILDVGGNHITMFPTDLRYLCLEELLCEGNFFVQPELLKSHQEMEVLTLKELAARQVLLEKIDKWSAVNRSLPLYPELANMLSQVGRCAVCHKPFLTTWLECVHFLDLKKEMGMKRKLTVPVRAVLCSYTCFNEGGHDYYGIASVVQ
ncbi:leucine-rich repeat-containing protein 69 [Engraulis encrasicolus]|uniref:leucine-rich repeat-containing protein 69 n=1 Tax=Engraulis encrasicolus TaxID=184585 RepID=UPI002FCF5DE7